MRGESGQELDWNLVRTFVAVVEQGSLAGAARVLNFAHPTVARHIQQLESQLGVVLFERGGQGLKINDVGERLAEVAAQMRRQAAAFESVSELARTTTGGRVRITLSELLADLVPELLLPLREDPAAGERQIEVEVSPQLLNLLDLEADIAIRHVRPVHSELVCRRVGALPLGAWVAESYIERNGTPHFDRLDEHWFVDGASEQRFAAAVEQLGVAIPSERIGFRSDSLRAQLKAAELGWGVVGIPDYLGEARPGLRKIFADAPGPVYSEIWLVARPAMRQQQFLRMTFECLASGLEARFGGKLPGPDARAATRNGAGAVIVASGGAVHQGESAVG
ncbi:MAG: LysR family transcriptional regulator [Pseudomonadales bacterium]